MHFLLDVSISTIDVSLSCATKRLLETCYSCAFPRAKGTFYLYTGPPEGIISNAKIVSQLYRALHQREPCLIKDPTFVTGVVVVVLVVVVFVAVARHPADFISVASTEGFRKPATPAALDQHEARNALRNLKNLFSAGGAHALFLG